MPADTIDDRLFSEFHRDVSRRLKRYRNCRKDVEAFARILDNKPDNQLLERMSGFDPHLIYKVRVLSRDIPGGKRSGFRVILLDDGGVFRFVMIYTHNTEPSESDMRNEVQKRLKNNGFNV